VREKVIVSVVHGCGMEWWLAKHVDEAGVVREKLLRA